MSGSRYIDIHVHAQRVEGAPRYNMSPFSSAAQLLRRYDELGIEKVTRRNAIELLGLAA